jgi:lipopolysaccharide export LptBFGC system permease protein LptF
MIHFLTSNPLARAIGRSNRFLRDLVAHFFNTGDKRGLAMKVTMGLLVVGLGAIFYDTLENYQDSGRLLKEKGTPEDLTALPSIMPVFWQGGAVFVSLVAFLVSLWVNERNPPHQRKNLVLLSLWIAAFAGLIAWLPTDIVATKQAIYGKALAGETPSIGAYLGGLFLITMLVLSIPASAMVYYRLSLMDRYTIHSFLSPFAFCMFSMIAIWVIADITDNGDLFAGAAITKVLWFYVVQIPYVILFVMPIVVLLAGLFSLSNMSKSNELISMIGAGRSVVRILMPLFVIGAYASLISLAFKYEWAPSAVGYKEAIIETAKKEAWMKKHGERVREDVWARRGWMHVNEVDNRTWFVGKIPLRLSDDMADVVVWQLDRNGDPRKIWKAARARWDSEAEPPVWRLFGTTLYSYDEKHIPRITSRAKLVIDTWSETPWKVLSSSQNPEYLGLSGLTMYLEANADMDPVSLAPFRTNWWYIFAEPLTCLTMILVAAPLGIVYSRRGVMGGVTGAIVIFALMYVMRGTVLALGHRNSMDPFWAAWSTNIVIGGIGLVLLWFRGQNREIPKLRSVIAGLFRKKPKPEAPKPAEIAA